MLSDIEIAQRASLLPIIELARRIAGSRFERLEGGGHLLFLESPERFIPLNAGRCPVGQVDRGESVAGNPRWGVLYQGPLYLCADGRKRAR